MFYSELRDCHIVTEMIRAASRSLSGNARDTVIFGYSHDAEAEHHITHGERRTRSGTLLMTGVPAILCRNH